MNHRHPQGTASEAVQNRQTGTSLPTIHSADVIHPILHGDHDAHRSTKYPISNIKTAQINPQFTVSISATTNGITTNPHSTEPNGDHQQRTKSPLNSSGIQQTLTRAPRNQTHHPTMPPAQLSLNTPQSVLIHHHPAFLPSLTRAPLTPPRRAKWAMCTHGPPRRARRNHNPRAARRRPMQDIMDAQRLRKKGDWLAAKMILQKIYATAKHDTDYLNETLHVHAAQMRDSGASIAAEQLYKELYDLSQSIPAPENATTFNAILMALRGNKKNSEQGYAGNLLKVAVQLFDCMLQSDVFPDQFTMSILFQICATCRDATYTKYFDDKSRRVFGFKPNVVSGSALVSAYAKCGELALVEQVLHDLEARNVNINARTYAPIISACHRGGNHAKVIKYFDAAMRSSSVDPNVYIFSSTLASCSKARDTRNARRVFQQMEDANVEPTEIIITTMFETAIRSSDIQLGLQVLLDWAPKYAVMQPQRVHFSRLISVCKDLRISAHDVVITAKQIIYRMQHEANIAPTIETYNVLISTFVKLRLFREANQVLENDILQSGLQPNVETYNAVIYSLGRSGNPQLAVQLFYNMKKRQLAPSQVTYNILLDVLVEAKQTKLINIISNEMRNDPNFELNSLTLSSYLKQFRAAGDHRSAMQLFSHSVRDGTVLDEKTHGLLLTILFETGHEADAISVFGWLLWKGLINVTVCNVILDHLGREVQSLTRCLMLFKNMKRKGIAPDAKTYAVVIRSCSRNGQIDRAFRFLGEMQDVGIGLNDTFAWTALIDGCGRAGQWQRAVELLKCMQQADASSSFIPPPTTASYNAALYAAGMHGGGWKVVADIYKGLVADESQQPDMVTYSAMASTILRNRSEITEWDIVRDVYRNLKAAAEADGSKRGNSVTERTPQQTLRASDRLTPVSRKLNSKLRRLDWLLRVEDGKRTSHGRMDAP